MQEYTPPKVRKVEFYLTTNGFHPRGETAQKISDQIAKWLMTEIKPHCRLVIECFPLGNIHNFKPRVFKELTRYGEQRVKEKRQDFMRAW